jgi:hypothetical protein
MKYRFEHGGETCPGSPLTELGMSQRLLDRSPVKPLPRHAELTVNMENALALSRRDCHSEKLIGERNGKRERRSDGVHH